MEKYPVALGSAYYYTADFLEIAPKVLDKMVSIAGPEFASEGFICCCWMENIFSKGDNFVIVTNQRLITRELKNHVLARWDDLHFVKLMPNGNLKLSLKGSTFSVFTEVGMCSTDLMVKTGKIILDILEQSVEKRMAIAEKEEAMQKGTVDIVAQIEKLQKLKEAGAITDEEFAKMKADYLTKM